MSRTIAFAALAVCCAVAASASRSPMDLLSMPWSSVTEAVSSVSSGKSSQGAYVNYKLFVAPDKVADFAKKYESYIAKPASKSNGHVMTVLSRPVVTNAIHYSYSEWDSMRDYLDFATSKDAMDFLAYLEDADIKYEIDFLAKPYNAVSEKAVAKKGQGKEFSVLVTVFVEPREASGWIQAFEDAQDETQDENGNVAYALKRVITTNSKFYVYGAWTSEEAWRDHLESDHVAKLAQYATKHNIIYIESPLINLISY